MIHTAVATNWESLVCALDCAVSRALLAVTMYQALEQVLEKKIANESMSPTKDTRYSLPCTLLHSPRVYYVWCKIRCKNRRLVGMLNPVLRDTNEAMFIPVGSAMVGLVQNAAECIKPPSRMVELENTWY